ncbi:MAG TPA: ParB N-terminal domain-containing protein [Sphingomicrobium sp.]|nr:ParB N-terminal domain-containing protein [Sphingomicrobium sp.]
MIKTIPLNKLVDSPRNMRRSSDPQADLELKADIEARGLLQNLVVTSVRKPKGCFAVEAGERRRKALLALAEEGKLQKDHGIWCLVVDADSGQEASLAENFQRLAMNPADECLAFSQLVEQGADPEGIARRFGLTVRFVEGRLRLASLAPVVFDALGAGEISLDIAKAYAATPDPERQAYVFEQVSRSYMSSHPDSIRRMMTQATVSACDRRAKFVGEEAYVAAGGRIERDLFADADEARWLDVALLERLASEKLEALAAATAAEQGLAFVRPTLDSWISYPATEGLRRIPVDKPPLTGEESARVEALEEQIGELVGVLDDEESDEAARAEAEEKIRALDGEIDAITDKPPVIDPELKAQIGTFLLLDHDGRPKLDSGFYAEIAADEGCGESDPGEASTAREQPAQPAQSPPPAGLPRARVDELAIQRRDILGVHVAADPAFALDLATFLMVDRTENHSSEKCGSTLSAARPSDPLFGFRTPDARATLAAAEAAEALDHSWTEGSTRAERFDGFRALSYAARAAWLGQAVARTLEASVGAAGERACAFHDHLGQLLGIEVSAWWRPTGANYFDRVPKAQALAALTEVGGPTLAGPYAKAKKAELSQACERIFSGDFIAEVEVKQAALAWVPEAMRFAAPADETAPDRSAGEQPADTQENGSDEAVSCGESPVEEIEEAA